MQNWNLKLVVFITGIVLSGSAVIARAQITQGPPPAPPTFFQLAELQATPNFFADFGYSGAVSFDGSTLVVGAPYDLIPGRDAQGSAYVFARQGNSWVRVAQLFASDGALGEYSEPPRQSASLAIRFLGYSLTLGDMYRELEFLDMANPQHLAIDSYLEELTELLAKRIEIERRAARVEKAVRAMIDLLDGEPEYESYMERFDDVTRPTGLTSAIRAILQAAGSEGLTPVEVRDYVKTMLIGHSNPLASVHTILKRLAKTDSVEKTTKGGQPAYKWVSTAELVVRDLQIGAVQADVSSGTHVVA